MAIVKRDKKKSIAEIANEVVQEAEKEVVKKVPLRFDKVVHTGSTLLDLNISGGRIRGGGIPGGILMEIFGGSGSGKTSLLASICANAQHKGGEVNVDDPESRLDQEYIEIFGVSLEKAGFRYTRSDTVMEAFENMRPWAKKLSQDKINVWAVDAVAALSTELEMEKGDKMGMKQAKEFSQNLRRHARILGDANLITIFNNQVRQSENGETTACGKAMEFYGSLRLRVQQKRLFEVEKELKTGVEIKKAMGIHSEVYVKKSTVDAPYRTCPLTIIFNHGIDDVRDQLQYYKDMTKETTYNCFDKKTYQSMSKAIEYIEKNEMQIRLRERTIDLWEEIEQAFKVERAPKIFW